MVRNSNYQMVCDEIAEAAKNCSRNPAEILLVAVTKQVDWTTACSLYEQGQRDFGENRIAEALVKQSIAPHNCRWHLIGTLQSNKVRKAVGKFSLIHSIDTLELAVKLSLASQEAGVVTPILLQANTSSEQSKHGLSPEGWKRCLDEVVQLKGVSIKGLMTMAPLVNDERIIRHCFAALRHLREDLSARVGTEADFHHLSMGMSRDFKVAVEEGATILRIGTALFNEE